MSKNLEIEFKTLISKNDFSRLKNYFRLEENDFFMQENHYFDTIDFILKQKNSGLRVRLFSNSAELTLKTPEIVGLLETTDILSLQQAHHIISNERLPLEGFVYDKLISFGINPSALRLIGSLKTKRAEKKLPQGLLALDESWYNQQHDFELELEVVNSIHGKADFLLLLDQLDLTEKPAQNKIQRMLASSKFG
ncbi:CYTH domain-containing protein [Enterococcus sp. LJL99]